MPPRDVLCDLCGGKFFAHSLPHHRKSCQKKIQVQRLDCPYCGMAVTQLEMDSHVSGCKAAKVAGAKPTGQSAQLRRRLAGQPAPLPGPSNPTLLTSKIERRGTATTASGRLISQTGLRTSSPAEMDPKPQTTGCTSYAGLTETAALVPCQVCGRTFNMDRIAKHQSVCLKLRKKRPIFQAQKQRVFMEGGSEGRVVGSAVSAVAGRTTRGLARSRCLGSTASQPLNPHWRQESQSFRAAIRAARAAPPFKATAGGAALPKAGGRRPQEQLRPRGKGGAIDMRLSRRPKWQGGL